MKKGAKKLICGVLAAVIMTFCVLVCLWNNWIPVNLVGEEKVAHLSIDDTISVFRDLTINKEKYFSLFDNELFQELQRLHTKYGASFSLYCYYEDDDFNLSMVPAQYHDEFKENEDWLTFGYHAKGPASELGMMPVEEILSEFEMTTYELKRITGSVSDTLRLSYYQGSKNAIIALHNKGIKVLLTSSINNPSYYLKLDDMEVLRSQDSYSDGDVTFIHTDICLDNLLLPELFSKLLFTSMNSRQGKIIAVFTHEWKMNPNMYDRLEFICRFLHKHDFIFVNNLGSYI